MRSIFMVACCLSALESPSPSPGSAPEPITIASTKAAITVADVVHEVVIGDPYSTSWADWRTRQHVSVISPDGERAAVVLRWGDVERRANVGALLVYQTSELLRSPAPRKVAEFASLTNRQPLALVKWLSDSRTLIFAATDGEQPSQIYRVDIQASVIERLTNEPAPVEWYDLAQTADRLVTSGKAPAVRPEQDQTCRRQGCLVTARTLWGAQRGSDEGSSLMSVHDLRTGTHVALDGAESSDADIESCNDELEGGLSPDGRFGIRSCTLKSGRWPGWWTHYSVDPELLSSLSKGNNFYALRLVITDLDSGESKALTEAPYIWNQPAPIWLDSGRRLLLVGALETLADASAAENARRRSARSLLIVDPVTRKSERVGAFDADTSSVTRSIYDEETQTLTLDRADSAGSALPAVVYRRTGRKWLLATSEQRPRADPSNGPRLVLQEDLNTRPVLIALDPATGAKRLVLDPNPWLAARQLGHVEEISWTLKDGQKWRGGLYYPPGHVAKARYPLVILTHGFNADRFSLFGYARNFAAQPLAAHGMMVLQVEEKLKSVVATPEEWPTVQAGYEAAIDHLNQLGLIDRSRVGIQGWSRTGPHVGYLLTHSSYPIAAAAFTSSADFGWWYYLAAGTPAELEANYGAAPFGTGLDVWQRFAPSFNLDRMRTPLFMWSDGNVAGLWDWYAGLRRLDKPVEYWFLPDGTHDVFKVGERLQTNQLLVDWFRFWLKDEEDPDAAKAEQYARWRKLRTQHEAAKGGRAARR